uniref:Beta-1,3-galactosyl-O-glycosyl-glycoprotein beta-1,6-N-acetylglucosaminyltransferase 3 n=1 Tax=Leptobrachium leishanense TaxID=445787 RepID=A0A8C5M2N4_9ANUR
MQEIWRWISTHSISKALRCYISTIMITVLVTVTVMQRTILDCVLDDYDRDISTMSATCRKRFYDELELPPQNQINCSKIIKGDREAIDKAIIDRITVKNRQIPLNETQYINLAKDCRFYKNHRKFITFSQSKEEEDFPIAFSMVIHEKIDMFERLLRIIYAPQNIYCVHVDDKAPDIFKEAVRAITSCFDNVFVATKLEKVVYASWSRVQADLNCMEDLLMTDVKWRYLLNTCGTDFPLKTNAEMVKSLKLLHGKNSMETEETPPHKKGRWMYHHNVDTDVHRTSTKKQPPPGKIQMFSGNAYIVVTRDFVKHLFENPLAKEVIEWEKDTYSPDEHMWASLHRIPGVPGSFPSHKKYDQSDLHAIARLVKWYFISDVQGGEPYPPCTGVYRRGICVYGVGDLQWTLQQHHLFANKFDSLVDNNAIQCMEQYLRYKTLYDSGL